MDKKLRLVEEDAVPAFKGLAAILIHEYLSITTMALFVGEGHWDLTAWECRLHGIFAGSTAQFEGLVVLALTSIHHATPFKVSKINLQERNFQTINNGVSLKVEKEREHRKNVITTKSQLINTTKSHLMKYFFSLTFMISPGGHSTCSELRQSNALLQSLLTMS